MVSSSALPFSVLVTLFYRVAVLYLATRIVLALKRQTGGYEDNRKLSEEEPVRITDQSARTFRTDTALAVVAGCAGHDDRARLCALAACCRFVPSLPIPGMVIDAVNLQQSTRTCSSCPSRTTRCFGAGQTSFSSVSSRSPRLPVWLTSIDLARRSRSSGPSRSASGLTWTRMRPSRRGGRRSEEMASQCAARPHLVIHVGSIPLHVMHLHGIGFRQRLCETSPSASNDRRAEGACTLPSSTPVLPSCKLVWTRLKAFKCY